MKFHPYLLAVGLAVVLAGCADPTTTTTTTSRTSSTSNTDGREAGSADPLTKYQPTLNGQGNANASNLAGRGTSALPTSNTVRGGH